MADESVQARELDTPVEGRFTHDAETHLWCAEALAVYLTDHSLAQLNEDIQDGLRYLLRCEIGRARNAWRAEFAARKARIGAAV